MKKRMRPKQSGIQNMLESKRQRLEATAGGNKIMRVIRTEREWERQALKSALEGSKALEELLSFEEINKLIYGTAESWASLWKNKRIPFEDFLSVFYERAWEVIQNYTWTTDFYLYETIFVALNKCGIDLIRELTQTYGNRTLHEALPLKDGFEEFFSDPTNVAQIVTDRLYAEQIFTDQERLILLKVYQGYSQRETARRLKKDRKTISRTIDRIRNKLEAYRSNWNGREQSLPDPLSLGA